MTGGRGVRLRAISIVTCWRVHVQGYRVYEAHEYHSPRPFMLPIIIEKERRNRARPPGKLASSMPLCIPSADTTIPPRGVVFIEPSLRPPPGEQQTRNRLLIYNFPSSSLQQHCLYREIDSPPCSRSIIIIGRVSYFIFNKVGVCNESCIDSTFGGVWNYDVYSNRLNLVTLYINAIVVCPGERENCLNALKSI